MEIINQNLNIHYTSPPDVWEKLAILYSEMLGWSGTGNGILEWYKQNNDGRIINAFIEPSGLQFYAELLQEECDAWFDQFKTRASEILGFEVGEPEDGFEFHIYD